MGEVWRAYDTRRRRTVALKRLAAEQSDRPEFRARFRRESELAARLAAPNVIPIHDYGEIDGRRNGCATRVTTRAATSTRWHACSTSA